MNNQNILRSTALLTASGIIAKTVDFVFRAYYSRCLGSEGTGIFSLVFSLHGIMLNIATGGLGVAVSKLVSEQLASRRLGDVRRSMSTALFAVSLLSLAVIAAACIFSKSIAANFLKEPRAALSIVCLAPSILFMGVSYCIKGYFYASRRVLPPASSEFLEQAVKISVIKALLSKMLPLGLQHGCEAVFLGLSIGELSSCLYLFVIYLHDRRRLRGEASSEKVFSSMLKISIPVMTTSIAGSFLRMREEVCIVTALRKFGLNQTSALSLYGNIRGMVMPLIAFPLTLLSSCFTLLVPEISRASSMKNPLRLKALTARIYRFTAFFGFLVMTVIWVFARPLVTLVYSAPSLAPLLRLLCPIAPFIFMDSVSCGILNGLGKQGSLLLYGLSDSLIRLFLIYAFMPHFGIKALVFITAASSIYAVTLSLRRVLCVTEIHFEVSGWLLKHAVVAALTILITHSLKAAAYCINAPQTVLGIFFAVLIYVFLSTAISSVSRADFSWLVRRMFFNT